MERLGGHRYTEGHYCLFDDPVRSSSYRYVRGTLRVLDEAIVVGYGTAGMPSETTLGTP